MSANHKFPESLKGYPQEAYSPSGELWWTLHLWPGRKNAKFGTEPKLAAWLSFNSRPGDVITLEILRKALGGDSGRNNHEHFNRRFRNLRKYGWSVHSSRDAAGLEPNEYRLEKIGDPIWLGKSKYGKKAPSAKVRRAVFQNDGHRCVLCGIGAGETYPDNPTKVARLTLGHFVADALKGPNDPVNLRTECSECNEPAKEEAARTESAEELWPKMRSLGRSEKARLLSWIEKGHRERDEIDRLFDQYRTLPALQREELRLKLQKAISPPR